MIITHLTTLALLLQFATATTPQAGPSSQMQPQARRGPSLLDDIHTTFSGLFYRHKRSHHRSVALEKRSSGVNVRNQCVLRPADNPLNRSNGSATATTTAGGSKATPTSAYKKVLDSSGSNFFSDWTFWSEADPTNGVVQYTSSSQASSSNLTSIKSNGNAIMRVDTTPVVTGNRMSVRIQSNSSFNQGLWIVDSVHMPIGCAVWPAFWTVGPDWPNNGEIDIIEGVNENTYNQASLHTGSGCTINSDFGGTGTLVAQTDCAAMDTGNQGCGIRFNDSTSYGAGFNSNGGGVYAMLVDPNGINVWFFERKSIPRDITSEAPNPSGWGSPAARWPATTCSPETFIHDHSAIFDTTLCGDWAAGAWATAPNGGGQSCAAQTGVATCEQFVANSGSSFSEAYWEIKYVRVFQTS